jgi:pilus assembly protein CpaF
VSLLDRIKKAQPGAPAKPAQQPAARPAAPAAPPPPSAAPAGRPPAPAARGAAGEMDRATYEDLKVEVQARLLEKLDAEQLKQIQDENQRRDYIRDNIEKILITIGSERELSYSSVSHKKLVQEVLDEIVGLGPIESLIQDDTVTEVMVNGPAQIYVERSGRLVLTDKTFRDNDHVMQIVDKIVAPLGRRIDENSPLVDARLKDGSRVNCIIPPCALNGPCITIRKFGKKQLTVKDLINYGSLTQDMADFLAACIKIRLNGVVSGGTGSGKTTTLNLISSFIPSDERIVTVEDAAELQLRQEHVVSLETKNPDTDGRHGVSIRELVKNCLRMRPDRIIVGEVRGGEALDMLQAMNTGHDGSLTTGHANTPRDMISRLETMVLMAGMDLPMKAVRTQIASAVDIIVQQSRLRDGSRKITHVTEVQGMEGDVVTLSDIFRFEQTGVDDEGKILGRLKPTGLRPGFMHKFQEEGIVLPARIFTGGADGAW